MQLFVCNYDELCNLPFDPFRKISGPEKGPFNAHTRYQNEKTIFFYFYRFDLSYLKHYTHIFHLYYRMLYLSFSSVLTDNA